MTEYYQHTDTKRIFSVIRKDSSRPGYVLVTDVRTGLNHWFAEKSLCRITGVKGAYRGDYKVLEILWSEVSNDYIVTSSLPGDLNHFTMRLGLLKEFTTEPLVSLVKEPEFIKSTRQYAIERWSHAAVRGAENLIVGRAYNYVRGNMNCNPDEHDTIIIVGVDAENGTYSYVAPATDEWRFAFPDMSHIQEGYLQDAGVILTGTGKWNCNFMIPVGTKPHPDAPKRDFVLIDGRWTEGVEKSLYGNCAVCTGAFLAYTRTARRDGRTMHLTCA